MLNFKDQDVQKKVEEKKKEDSGEEEEDPRKDNEDIISKTIKLKNNRICDDLFAYIRMSLIQKHKE